MCNMALNQNDQSSAAQFKGHRVEHFQQRYNWDCGISCVLMVLSSEHREKVLEEFHQLCQEEGFGQSTWTIDLCYLLKRFNIKHKMYTRRKGVNENYRKYNYYNKIIDLDTARVRRRFQMAEQNGIDVVEQEISDLDILDHVLNVGPAILLVDSGLLACDLCKHNKMKVEFRRMFGGAYRGHYILLVGRSSRGKWAYRDPALAPRVCVSAPARLRRARRAPGTDADVILVYNDYR